MKRYFLLCLLLLLLLIPAAALGETARDITGDCSIVPSAAPGRTRYMLDDDYLTPWYTSDPGGVTIDISAPGDQYIGGVYIKWNLAGPSWTIDVFKNDAWQPAAQNKDGFAVEYIPLPEGTTRFRLCRAEDDDTEFRILELRVYSPGDLPADVQCWQPVADKCDLMVITAHADDEYLYMGGTIPYYLAQGKSVQVVYVSPSASYRYLELLDGLWLCGMRNYPVIGKFPDKRFMETAQIYSWWGQDALRRFLVSNIRQFQPDVIVTHDLKGEYGHAAHIATAKDTVWAVEHAADESCAPQSAAAFGTWQVQKLYLHLYKQNQLVMDWSQPLDFYGGESAFSVAEQAFAMHRSQQNTNYRVKESGPYDCRLFGLYFSAVGEDILRNDFLENVE